jgi:gluconate 2-dehydrogenase gamma chain
MPDGIPRRTFIAASAAGIGALWLGVKWLDLRKAGEHAATAASNPAYRFATFNASQAADVDAFAAQIIPSEEGSPGAREAHVVNFIDHMLANVVPDTRPDFLRGLADFQSLVAKRHPGKSFAQLGSAEQQALIRELEGSKSDFFEMMRTATITGMFAAPEYHGNFDKTGWKLIGFEDRFSWQPPFGFYDSPSSGNA